jgi:hypothetical protein
MLVLRFQPGQEREKAYNQKKHSEVNIMPIMFNTALREAGLSLGDVCVLRHQDNRSERGRTPYELWRDDRPTFDLYQSHQNVGARQKLSRPYWAAFGWYSR